MAVLTMPFLRPHPASKLGQARWRWPIVLPATCPWNGMRAWHMAARSGKPLDGRLGLYPGWVCHLPVPHPGCPLPAGAALLRPQEPPNPQLEEPRAAVLWPVALGL